MSWPYRKIDTKHMDFAQRELGGTEFHNYCPDCGKVMRYHADEEYWECPRCGFEATQDFPEDEDIS